MDIWAGYAMRRRECVLCTVRIEPGDRVFWSQTKRTFPWGTRTNRRTSHFDCYVSKASVWFDDHPYIPTTDSINTRPGRPVKYTSEQSQERRQLRANILRWNKKQQEYTGDGMWGMAGRYGEKVHKARAVLDSM